MAEGFINELLRLLSVNLSTVLLLVSVTLVVHRFLSSRNRYNPPLPPSPMVALPVIGHLYLLDNDIRKPFRKYHKQLGDVYSLMFGNRLVIVIAGYKTLKDAFVKQGEDFLRRPSMYITDRCNRDAGVVMTSGDVWKEHRLFSTTTLKNFGMGKTILEDKIQNEATNLIKELRKNVGEPLDPKTVIAAYVANVITSIVFKGNFKHDDPRIVKMIDIFEENLELTAGVANFLPWLAKIPGDPMKIQKLVQNSDQLFEYAGEIIAEHEREYDENDVDDLTTAYIHELRRLKAADQQMAGLIGDLFIAGSHTTATTIRWAISCLVNYPDIQEKVYSEISNILGTDRLPSVQDRSKLVYLEAFYLEVLRYCNLTITSAVHATTHDLVFKGFTIPQDAVILPDLDSVFTDSEIWGDPDTFRPERFLDELGNLKKKDELIIFFIGKRNCLGESLARMELLIFLGSLIQTFKFESCPGEALTVEKNLFTNLKMSHPLLFDATWTQQWKYESAEAFYQQVLAGTGGQTAATQETKVTQGSNLKSEIAQARQNIQKALNDETGGKSTTGGAADPQVLQRIKSLETENQNLKKSAQDLTALVKKLEARVMALEKSNTGSGSVAPSTTAAPAAPAAPVKKEEKDDDDDDDDDFDMFDDESDEEESEATKARLAAYYAKKAKKPAIIAKSSLLIDVKPWDDETDMGEMEKLVRTIEMEGLVWGAAKLIPVGYGIKKLQINAVIEDDKVSTDDLEDKITGFEDFVQSMDIAAFNKL
ncbi:Cytochrome P450 2C8 [Mactra antiquata]